MEKGVGGLKVDSSARALDVLVEPSAPFSRQNAEYRVAPGGRAALCVAFAAPEELREPSSLTLMSDQRLWIETGMPECLESSLCQTGTEHVEIIWSNRSFCFQT